MSSPLGQRTDRRPAPSGDGLAELARENADLRERVKQLELRVKTVRGAAIADATGTLASVTARLNDLLAQLRTQQRIAP